MIKIFRVDNIILVIRNVYKYAEQCPRFWPLQRDKNENAIFYLNSTGVYLLPKALVHVTLRTKLTLSFQSDRHPWIIHVSPSK